MKDNKVLYCNKCAKKIKQKNGVPVEDVLYVKKAWGYFSQKDGIVHEFCICEECYDKMVKQFEIPVAESKQKEFL